jgi:hypothetical protein
MHTNNNLYIIYIFIRWYIIPKKEKIEEITVKDFQNLIDQVKITENDINFIKKEINSIKSDILSSQERIEQTIKTQEEIIMDMINKFNEELLKHKTTMNEDMQKLKTQQDVLKISYTINEKKLTEKIDSSISKAINRRIEGKESEILMKIWINEFKDIISDFEKFKKLRPKEFSVRLNEISDTIDVFKQKILEQTK